MSRYVIVPLDGSKLAEEALPLGISLAQEVDSASVVQLVQVIPTRAQISAYLFDDSMTLQELSDTFRASAEGYLEQIKIKWLKAGVSVEILALDSNDEEAGPALAALANREEASYLVMSTHGRGGISRWALGSVADQILHLIERPLIIMRPQTVSDTPLVELSDGTLNVTNLPQLKRIVVPLDGTPFAEQVLPHAKKLARAYDAQLLLFRAISLMPSGVMGSDVAVLETKMIEMNRNQARDYLKGIRFNLEAEGFKVRVKVRVGQPTDGILTYAKEVEADLIAISTHAPGTIRRMVMGSVADALIRAGEVPVLTTKTETKE